MRIHPGVSLVTAFVLAGAFEMWFPASRDVPLLLRAGFSAVAFLTGAVVLFRAVHVLREAGTTIEPFLQPAALVTSGPFRVSRNPMYVTNVLMLTGFACLTCSAWFLVSAVAQFALLNSLIIPGEETKLRSTFPEAAASWFARTRRWL